jgi:hypothetical protein
MYKIAGARETPKIDVHLIEEYLGRSSTDAAGVGEPSTIPTAAAVANAVYNATGVRMLELPMTPDRVLSALRAARSCTAVSRKAAPAAAAPMPLRNPRRDIPFFGSDMTTSDRTMSVEPISSSRPNG